MSSLSDFRAALQSRESDRIEFLSSALMPRLIQTICALANTYGGVIYVGVADTPDESRDLPVERSVMGVDPATIQRVIGNLETHFDDPLPQVREEQLAHRGPRGPVVAIHVERHTGDDKVALSDLTIWERDKGQNVSFMARARPIRSQPQSVEHELTLSDKVVVDVDRSGAQPPDSADAKNIPPAAGPDDGRDSATHPRLGSRSLFRREALDEETALNAEGYADVIATLLSSADDDERMSIAIFGHWGRGKTFLARRVAERLKSPGVGGRRYKTVLFSAWKYRTPPEVWAYLFERFLEEGKAEIRWLALRAAFVRHGPWPLISAMFALFLSLWAMGERLNVLTAVTQAVGVGTLLYVGFLFVRFRSVAIRLQSLYAFAGHADKLGLQAAIGDDLRALLTAWCRLDLRSLKWNMLRHFLWPYACYLLAGGLITWKLWPVREGAYWTLPFLGEVSLSVNPYVGLALYGLWCVSWIVAPFVLFFHPRRASDRVLLVVDDLDRCGPTQMLEIIESTMLILDDRDVHRRLQVCMLVDESAFSHALLAKYKQLLGDEHVDVAHRYTAARIVRENLEKFFLVHLRLSALTDSEISDVTNRYVQQLRGSSSPDVRPTQTSIESDATKAVTVAESGSDPIPSQRAESILDRGSVIVPEEADALVEFVRHHLSRDGREIIGPRTLRCLLFRYQLARDILLKLGEHPDARELANVVVAVYLNASEPSGVPSQIETVVRQVS